MKIEDYFKYYIQGSDHYLIPKDVFMELFNEMINWKEESKRIKETLEDTNEELELVRCDLHNRTSERDSYYKNIELLETQQQEFIKWLEDYLKLFDNMCIDEQGYYDMFEEILQKYKIIIGDDK